MMKNYDKTIKITFAPGGAITPVNESILSELMEGDCDLLGESTSIEDIENTFHPDGLISFEEHILSAIVTRNDRLSRTMKALIKTLNQSLTGTNLIAGADAVEGIGKTRGRIVGNAIVSKPRKSGLVAVVTAQIPISDGQSVFIMFHAPDEDPLVVNETDTLIAFKFLLNKRDITHVVAPHQGRDISLKQTTQAISNVVERNSEKFQLRRQQVQKDKLALDKLLAESEIKEEESAKLNQKTESKEATLKELLSKQKDKDIELRKHKKLNEKLESEISLLEVQKSERIRIAKNPDLPNARQSYKLVNHEGDSKPDVKSQSVDADSEINFENGNTVAQLIEIWDSMKKDDLIKNYLGRMMGSVKKKPTKAQNAVTLIDSEGYEIRYSSEDLVGFDLKATRSSDKGKVQTIDENLNKERESKAKILVEGDKFFHRGEELRVNFINYAENKVEIQHPFIINVASKQMIESEYNIKVAGVNAEPVSDNEPQATPLTINDYLDQSDVNNPENPKHTARHTVSLIKEASKKRGFETDLSLESDFEGLKNVILRLTISKHESKAHFQILSDGKAALFSDDGERAKMPNYNYSSDKSVITEKVNYFDDHVAATLGNSETLDLQAAEPAIIEQQGAESSPQENQDSKTILESELDQSLQTQVEDESQAHEGLVEEGNQDLADFNFSPVTLSKMVEIDQMKLELERKKKANAATRKYNRKMSKSDFDERAAFDELLSEFKALNLSETFAKKVISTPNYMGNIVAFEKWDVTNLRNRIKNGEARLEEIKKREVEESEGDKVYNLDVNGVDITVEVDHDDKRIRIHFNELSAAPKESDPEFSYWKAIAKSSNYSPTNQAWQRKITDNAKRDIAWAFNFRNWEELVQNARIETPDAETPDAETPDVETPDVETPDVETPDVETPDVETPDVETPDVETPDVETPDVETPDVETPDVETPDVETPDVETPDVETPDVETPDVETPDVETPDVETPDVETPDAQPEIISELVELTNSEKIDHDLLIDKLEKALDWAESNGAEEIYNPQLSKASDKITELLEVA